MGENSHSASAKSAAASANAAATSTSTAACTLATGRVSQSSCISSGIPGTSGNDGASCSPAQLAKDARELYEIRNLLWGPSIRIDVFRRWSQGAFFHWLVNWAGLGCLLFGLTKGGSGAPFIGGGLGIKSEANTCICDILFNLYFFSFIYFSYYLAVLYFMYYIEAK